MKHAWWYGVRWRRAAVDAEPVNAYPSPCGAIAGEESSGDVLRVSVVLQQPEELPASSLNVLSWYCIPCLCLCGPA